MYKYRVQIKKVSGRLNESVLPSKSLIVKSKTKKSKSAILSEASKFFKKKYGLVIESADVQFSEKQPTAPIKPQQLIKMGISPYYASAIAQYMRLNDVPLENAKRVEEETYSYDNIWEMIEGEGIFDTLNDWYDWSDDYGIYDVESLRNECMYGELDEDEVEEIARNYVKNNSGDEVYFDGQITIFIRTDELRDTWG
ncbi:MAG: hypothetical protein J6R59_01460 [Paludibacteraceae bacterium]|nr:hypothetical protein [Paludibacteraceae bacterium]